MKISKIATLIVISYIGAAFSLGLIVNPNDATFSITANTGQINTDSHCFTTVTGLVVKYQGVDYWIKETTPGFKSVAAALYSWQANGKSFYMNYYYHNNDGTVPNNSNEIIFVQAGQ